MDIQELKTFLDSAHSVYHAVAGLVWELEAAGFSCLSEAESWHLSPGGKYYITRGGSSLVAFQVPQSRPAGFRIAASHGDRPTFKVKENGELTGKYTRLTTEKYGGMILAPWLDRPLSVAGRVMVETEDGVESRLVDIDRDLLLSPNAAIHMNRQVNDGYKWDLKTDLTALLGGEDAAGRLSAIIEEDAGGRILGQDLYLYVRQGASHWGMDQEYISAPALDDLLGTWCCAQGFLAGECTDAVSVLCVFDNEEVGSQTTQGADSDLMSRTLTRISESLELDHSRMLSQSFMVSADNAHALHPNHPEYADPENAPVINRGVVLKFNASQKYLTDGATAAVIRRIGEKAGVPMQTYYNRADMLGGSTLGKLSVSQASIPTADVGLAQLAMHSCYETAGVRDTEYMVRLMTKFYSVRYACPEDGVYLVD